MRVLQCSASPIRGRFLKSFFSCPCHLCLAFHTSQYLSCFASQCRQSGLTQQNRLCATVLDGPDSISSRLAPLHTCTNVFVLHLVMPPHLVPCSVMPYFFFCPPHLTATFLGCVGGSKPCFRGLQGLPSEGMTPIISPISFLYVPRRQTVFVSLLSFSWNDFSLFCPPFWDRPSASLAPPFVFCACFSLVLTLLPPPN